jgi:hypothetical protein
MLKHGYHTGQGLSMTGNAPRRAACGVTAGRSSHSSASPEIPVSAKTHPLDPGVGRCRASSRGRSSSEQARCHNHEPPSPVGASAPLRALILPSRTRRIHLRCAGTLSPTKAQARPRHRCRGGPCPGRNPIGPAPVPTAGLRSPSLLELQTLKHMFNSNPSA